MTAALSELQPLAPAALIDPFETDRVLRREAPVHRDPATGIFFVSSHAAVRACLANGRVFSSGFAAALGGGAGPTGEMAQVMAEGYPNVDTLITADPPAHTRYRKLSNRAFVPRRIRALGPRVQAISDELVAGFASHGRVELHESYSQKLPLTVIAEQLGVPREDLLSFRRWSDAIVAQLGQQVDHATRLESARQLVEFQKYFAARLEERRSEPQQDILSDIVNARFEQERPLDIAECLSILNQLLVAGNETTANTITEGMWLLAQQPELVEQMAAHPERIANLVEEVLRLASPVASMWRRTTEDTEVSGVTIPKHAMVMLRFASANRDEQVFPDPDRLDPERVNAADHLAFGHGSHFCLGAPLARLELDVAFRSLLTRFRDWQLDGPSRVVPNVLLRGRDALPLRFAVR